MLKRGILRVIDVNFNRTKEGLRVIEDIFRFIVEDDKLRRKIRTIRHSLDAFINSEFLKAAVIERDSSKDLGRALNALELNRKNYLDILYVNFQRVKESLRVIEEFFKIIQPGKVKSVKNLRYEIYALERQSYIKYFKNA